MDNEKTKKFIESARSSGVPDAKIVEFLKSKGVNLGGESPQAAPNSFTGSEKAPFQATGKENLITGTAKAVGNIPSSGFELAKNVGSALIHPIDTVKAIGNTAKGLGAKVGETLLEHTDIGQSLLEKANENRIKNGQPELKRDASGKLQAEDTPDLQAINQVGKFFGDRYGSVDKFKETAIEDPVSVLADIATVLSGGGAAISKLGEFSKIGEIAKVGSTVSKLGETIEPITAATKTLGRAKEVVSGSAPSRMISEIIPTIDEVKRGEVAKSLGLTKGDLSTISKSTGNDAASYIISKNLIKESPEAIADALNEARKATMETVRGEIGKVNKTYPAASVPRVKQGLDAILAGVEGVPGLEDVANEIKTLANKTDLNLSDIQRAKELLDENSNIYTKFGDAKTTATARGLDNIRKDLRKFIEDEVKTSTNGQVDIGALNNEVSTTYAIEDAIKNRAPGNIAKAKLSVSDSAVLFGGGAVFSPAVGIGLYLGKKLVETPSFRLAFTKALSSQPVSKIKTILTEIRTRTVSPATQKLINTLADEARNNLPTIESGSNLLERTKEEPQNKINQ